MLFNIRWLTTFLVSLFLGFHNLASAQKSVPIEVQRNISNPILSGEGQLSAFLFVTIFEAVLWVEKRPWDFKQKFALSLTYKKSFKKEKLVNTSIKEIKRYYQIEDKEYKYRKNLEEIFFDINSGDRLTAIFDPKGGLKFYYNGKDFGRIKDLSFAKKFIEIWLHPKAHYQQLKNDLINGGIPK